MLDKCFSVKRLSKTFLTKGELFMLKLKLATMAVALIGLAGCASNDYRLYAETQTKIAQANRDAEIARYQALAKIAETGDSASRVAAVISLNMSGNGGPGPRQVPVNPPQTVADKALQWTSVLLPSLTQVYGINANRQIAITQSNNQASVARSTNETFATMNGNMATSNTAIAGAGFTAVTNVANTGIAQVGATAADGLTAVTTVNASSNTAITNVSNAANASIQAVSATIPLIQPNVTTTTSTTTTTTNNTTAPTTP